MRAPVLAIAVCALLIAAGCGGDGDSPTTSASTTSTREDTTAADGSSSEGSRAASLAVAEDFKLKGKEPKVEVPEGPPPEELEVNELRKGSGPEAAPGDVLVVQYVGVYYENGKEFSSTWDLRYAPFSFRLGANEVIPGWEQGLKGMKVGSRRVLIVPPDVGYPSAGTTVFLLDLLAIR